MTIPAYAREDPKETELAKQRIYTEFEALGVDSELIERRQISTEDLETALEQLGRMRRTYGDGKIWTIITHAYNQALRGGYVP